MAVSSSIKKSYTSKYVGDISYLDHLNYNIWSLNAIIYLQAIKGYGLVTVANVKGFLLATCSLSVKRYLGGIGIAYEMWGIQKEYFDSASSTKRRLAIRKQFTDHAIDDESFKDYLLTSLPPAYNPLVEILQKQEGTHSIAEVIHQVLQAEMSKSQKGSEGLASFCMINHSLKGDGLLGSSVIPGSSSTYKCTHPPYVRSRFQGQSRKGSYSQWFQGNYNKCGQRGHKAASCLLEHSRPSVTSMATQDLYCFTCREAGHGIKSCPHSSLTQSKAAKGPAYFEKWLTVRRNSSGSTMAVSASNGSADLPLEQLSQF
ncbi:hypothetical protein HOY80DRAFT_1035013 [Tuber brumale]|nr:hypothetical protein HOY80DRAFT_1035013 [Tuber brumale]